MNNYIASDNCCNDHFRDNLGDQQNISMDQQTQNREHSIEKNNINDCDEYISMKASEGFNDADVNPNHYDFKAHDYQRQYGQHWQQQKQHDEHERQYDQRQFPQDPRHEQYEQPYDQQYEQPYDQQYEQPQDQQYEQQYGQHYDQQYEQTNEQPYDQQYAQTHEQQHERQPKEQHEGYAHNQRRTIAHPTYTYPDIKNKQFLMEQLEEPGRAPLSNSNCSKDISPCKMSNSVHNKSIENLYSAETNKNYDLPHESKQNVMGHSKAHETNMYSYNKKKSPFLTDSVQDSLNESPIRYNATSGDYEKYKGNENEETFCAKQCQNAYDRGEIPLYSSSLEARNSHEQCNSSEKKEFIGQECASPTKACRVNRMNCVNNGYSGYHYLNNASSEYIRDDVSLCSSNAREQRENANFFKEKNMSHTKIFDYIEPIKVGENLEQKGHKKKFVDTFVPRYKNVSARETLLKNLSGNDNITVLAANSMEFDGSKYMDKEENVLPNVYPFNISERVKTSTENIAEKKNIPKLLPTNYNYVNNYTSSSRNDMSLSQIRNHMTSSHIFDTDEVHQQQKSSFSEKKDTNASTRMSSNNAESKNLAEDRMEKMDIKEKRKKNPMYTDMFGRKTPDVDVYEPQKEKLLSATMQNNWIYHASDVKKYAEHSSMDMGNNDYEYMDRFEPSQDKFHRKSYFTNDGYDNTKRLQDALKKGSTYALQAHLQSSFQSENEDKTKNAFDAHTVQIYYLTLYNLKDSIHDEDIKKIVKNSEAYLVSYKPHYDLLSNVRKSTAKLCIRHNKGKQGLELLQHMFSQVQIKAVEQ